MNGEVSGGGLRFEDVRDRVGADVPVGDTGITLTLAVAVALPVAHEREGGAFRLEFSGPLDPMLPQAIYPLLIDGVRHDTFIVPVERSATDTRYEAIFN